MDMATTSKPKQVGQILIEHGLLNQAQLESALAAQKSGRERKLLGETIVELGFCTEEQVSEALAQAYGIPYACLTPGLFDPGVIDELPREFMQKQCVLPLFKVDNVLTVAVSEPSNVFLLEEINELATSAVQWVASTQRDINALLKSSLPDPNVFVIDDILDFIDTDSVDASSFDITDPDETGQDSPVIKLANYVIVSAVCEGASDIHIEPDDNQLRIRYRLDGLLVEKLSPPVQMGPPLIARIKIMASLDISERRLPQDGAIHVRMKDRPIDLRVSTLPNQFGEKIVIRIIDNKNVLVSLEHLGFGKETLDQFRQQIHQPYGLLLVTGPTGSGKSTTLYSSLAQINAPEVNICTVEDPIEFNLLGVNQFQVNEKIGFTFANTLRSLLRQDPDVIMVGEIRDSDTARIAVQAALTGHMVFSTLHTNDAAGAITRLYNVGVEPYLISASVTGVLAQRLVRRLCPHCSESVTPTPNVIHAAERLGQSIEKVYVGTGCSKCRQSGFSGRVGLFEMLVPDEELRDAITTGATLNQLRQLAKKSGMKTLIEDGFEKLRQGATTLE